MNLYKEVQLLNLDIGETFMYQNTLFEFIHKDHALCVALTVNEFPTKQDGKPVRQVFSLPDDELVLIKIEKELTSNGTKDI